MTGVSKGLTVLDTNGKVWLSFTYSVDVANYYPGYGFLATYILGRYPGYGFLAKYVYYRQVTTVYCTQ
jgi:hypothetical protein